MGNCLHFKKGQEKSNIMEIGAKEVKFVKDAEYNGNKGVRVKLVLTKEELQWLMLQLKNRTENGGAIEDVLGEIEKARSRVVSDQCWKLSLDSISEIHEQL